jgi:hypothetical protein
MRPNKGGGGHRNSLEEGLISIKGGGPQFFAVVLFVPFLPISSLVSQDKALPATQKEERIRVKKGSILAEREGLGTRTRRQQKTVGLFLNSLQIMPARQYAILFVPTSIVAH